MTAFAALNRQFVTPEPVAPVVVIGAGPVGMRVAERLAAAHVPVVVLNAEPVAPYNRVKLTPLLAGEVDLEHITLSVPAPADGAGYLSVHNGLCAVRIDREARQVQTSDGGLWPYDRLVLATGSTAHIPKLDGADLSGVFTFRDHSDVAWLIARSLSARKIAVIGGGLLGLEAARGMQRRGAKVTIVEHQGRLMPRQLDRSGAAELQARIEALGVEVRCGLAVAQIEGDDRVEAVRFRDGSALAADTVIFCTGVRANTWLASDAGLGVGRGIVVDDQLQTADPAIFAIGECAEHRGQVYGLVGPGLEQADAAASVIATAAESPYDGSVAATRLKVLGADVFSAGPVEQLDAAPQIESITYRAEGCYRRLFLDRGRLVGAIAVGAWSQASRAQQAVIDHAQLWPWQIYRFRRSGDLFTERNQGVATLPGSALICTCTGTSCGSLRAAVAAGAEDVPALQAATGAGLVCGSCLPQLEELTASGGPATPVRLWRSLLALSVLAGILVLFQIAAPRVPLPQSYGPDWRNMLWLETVPKQITGFGLLGITGLALALGLRKRWRWLDRLGSYDLWRLVHLGLGLAALAGLFLHTGFRPGANLNLWLFIAFSATLALGAIAGLATGGDHRLRDRGVGSATAPPRRLPVWGHILALWPLPVLILLHVLVVYSY